MVLIPADIGVRMRMQAEASLQAITPAQAIPGDLPALQTGQAFTARIQEVLPENLYRALVAGKSLTLSLPQGAQTGDTLELVVIDRTPRAVVAQLAPARADATAAEPYSNANLSPAGQLIGKLLLAKGEEPVAASLSRGQPVLAQPPRNGAELASKLNQAVTQSGLFYESHQAKWIAGQMTASDLRQEPQGQQPAAVLARQLAGQAAASTLQTLAQSTQTGQLLQIAGKAAPLSSPAVPLTVPPPSPPDGTYSPAKMQAQSGTGAQPGAAAANAGASTPASLPQTVLANETSLPERKLAQQASPVQQAVQEPSNAPVTRQSKERAEQSLSANSAASTHLASSLQSPFPLRTESSASTATTTSPAQQIPDDLRPLVQQQLDSVATQRLAWHGEVWPGQKMDWQIEWEKEAARNDTESAQDGWSTRLSLTTPRLGKVDATLKLAGDGIRITLATPYGASAADLRDGSATLTKSLEAAGIHVLGLQVTHETE